MCTEFFYYMRAWTRYEKGLYVKNTSLAGLDIKTVIDVQSGTLRKHNGGGYSYCTILLAIPNKPKQSTANNLPILLSP